MVGLLLIFPPGAPFLHDLSQINTEMKLYEGERMISVILQDQDLKKSIKQIENFFWPKKKTREGKVYIYFPLHRDVISRTVQDFGP